MNSHMLEYLILGKLIFELQDQGFAITIKPIEPNSFMIEFTDDEIPIKQHWIRIAEGRGLGLISDYSRGGEKYICKALDYVNALEQLDSL